MIQYFGLWLLIAIALNMLAWLSVVRSGARLVSLLIWTLVLVSLPGIGFLVWFVIGPRETGA